MTTKQQLLIDDVESLRARLNECSEEAAALRKEVIVLRDTSPSLHAMQHRMATMLRRAVDEVSEMQAEAQALIAAAKAEAEKLDAELARKRAETQSQLDEALRDAQQEREQLLADAKQEANHYCVICRLKSGRNRF